MITYEKKMKDLLETMRSLSTYILGVKKEDEVQTNT
jgi:hypothetical protein